MRPAVIRVLTLLIGSLFAPSLVAEEIQDVIFSAEFKPHSSNAKKTFEYNGKPVGEGKAAFQQIVEQIGKLPRGTSVVWGPNYGRCGACSGSEPENVFKESYPELWMQLEKHVASRGLTLSSDYPGPFLRRLQVEEGAHRDPFKGDEGKKGAPKLGPEFFVHWDNYQGPGTPHQQVLYMINAEYVGQGDEGFDRILQRVKKLPEGAEVIVPRYEYGGRWAHESLGREEIDARNKKLKSVLPFAARKRELGAVFVERKLKAEFSEQGLYTESPTTVLDWSGGDRDGRTFVQFGHIIRHDEKSNPAPSILDWRDYEPVLDSGPKKRASESTARYTLNDKDLGQGITGFAKAMDQLAGLPAGSVVQVRVCLRTKGPFLCPLIYEGQRHFERTGFEPYFGLFPWLIDVARKHKLEIQWLPDEGKSCGDCELNR